MFRTATLGIALGLFLGAAAVAAAVDIPEAGEPLSLVAAAAPDRIELQVTGLSCPFCAYGLQKKLETLKEVEKVAIDLETGQVLLDVRDGTHLSDERIRAVVQEAGFAVTGIKRSGGPAGSPEPSPGAASSRPRLAIEA